MSNTVIRVENLGKKYIIGHQQQGGYKTLRDAIASSAKSLVKQFRSSNDKPQSQYEEFWALKDVSFEVKQGEVVGIIGRNGAGKSTLLKILSRITEPTIGEVRIKGRVASLLEVGTGFHPELTGRENIFLNGAILGMSRVEIKKKFDEIVDFAEVEKFIDTPVKHYSSGMYVRLAFAVAAHLEHEILIVDEVLAVGDAQFQKKCLAKMEDASKKEGRTLLFVSHNVTAIKSLCHTGILLQSGQQIMSGNTEDVIQKYLENGLEVPSQIDWLDMQSAPGNEKAKLQSVRILTAKGQQCNQFNLEDPIIIEIKYRVLITGSKLNLSISLFTRDDTYVLASPSLTDKDWFQVPHPPGLFCSHCILPSNFLNQGRYYVTVILVESGSQIIAQLDKVLSLEMFDMGTMRKDWFGNWGGVVRLKLDWETQYIDDCNDISKLR